MPLARAQSITAIKKRADAAFTKKDFESAKVDYRQLLAQNQKNIELTYKYATCIYYTEDIKNARKYYDLIIARKDAEFPLETYYYLAKIYQHQYYFETAIQYFNLLQEKDVKLALAFNVSNEILACKSAMDGMKDMRTLQVIKKSEPFGAAFYDHYTFLDDTYSFYKASEVFSKENAKHQYEPIYAFKKGMKFRVFASYGPESPNLDVYIQRKNSANEWEKPLRILGAVNTMQDEVYPFFDSENGYLYFSSMGHQSMGGFDLYRAVYSLETNTSSNVENLHFPFSSPNDDYFYIPDLSNGNANFASNRNGKLSTIQTYLVSAAEIPKELYFFTGVLSDKIDQSNSTVKLEFIVPETNERFGPFISQADGVYLVGLPGPGSYQMEISITGSNQLFKEELIFPIIDEEMELQQELIYSMVDSKEQLQVLNRIRSKQVESMQMLSQKMNLAANLDVNLASFNRKVNVTTEQKIQQDWGVSAKDTSALIAILADSLLAAEVNLENQVRLTNYLANELEQANDQLSKEMQILDERLVQGSGTIDPIENERWLEDTKQFELKVSKSEEQVRFLESWMTANQQRGIPNLDVLKSLEEINKQVAMLQYQQNSEGIMDLLSENKTMIKEQLSVAGEDLAAVIRNHTLEKQAILTEERKQYEEQLENKLALDKQIIRLKDQAKIAKTKERTAIEAEIQQKEALSTSINKELAEKSQQLNLREQGSRTFEQVENVVQEKIVASEKMPLPTTTIPYDVVKEQARQDQITQKRQEQQKELIKQTEKVKEWQAVDATYSSDITRINNETDTIARAKLLKEREVQHLQALKAKTATANEADQGFIAEQIQLSENRIERQEEILQSLTVANTIETNITGQQGTNRSNANQVSQEGNVSSEASTGTQQETNAAETNGTSTQGTNATQVSQEGNVSTETLTGNQQEANTTETNTGTSQESNSVNIAQQETNAAETNGTSTQGTNATQVSQEGNISSEASTGNQQGTNTTETNTGTSQESNTTTIAQQETNAAETNEASTQGTNANQVSQEGNVSSEASTGNQQGTNTTETNTGTSQESNTVNIAQQETNAAETNGTSTQGTNATQVSQEGNVSTETLTGNQQEANATETNETSIQGTNASQVSSESANVSELNTTIPEVFMVDQVNETPRMSSIEAALRQIDQVEPKNMSAQEKSGLKSELDALLALEKRRAAIEESLELLGENYPSILELKESFNQGFSQVNRLTIQDLEQRLQSEGNPEKAKVLKAQIESLKSIQNTDETRPTSQQQQSTANSALPIATNEPANLSELQTQSSYVQYANLRISYQQNLRKLDSLIQVKEQVEDSMRILLTQENEIPLQELQKNAERHAKLTKNIEESNFLLQEQQERLVDFIEHESYEWMMQNGVQARSAVSAVNGSTNLSTNAPVQVPFAVTTVGTMNQVFPTHPINVPLPEGLIFRVQVGAFRKPVPNQLFREFGPVSGEVLTNGLTCYLAGYFNGSLDAVEARTMIRGLGYADAFIVAYCDGKRMTYNQGKALEANGQCRKQSKEEMQLALTQLLSQQNNPQVQTPVAIPVAVDPNSTEANLDLYYTVQVAVYNKPLIKPTIQGVSELLVTKTEKGQFRYSSGEFTSFAEARDRKNFVVGKGIPDAYVVAYYRGKRISIGEANKLLASGIVPKKRGENTPSMEINTPQVSAIVEIPPLIPVVKKDSVVQFELRVNEDNYLAQLKRFNRVGTFTYQAEKNRIISEKYLFNNISVNQQLYLTDMKRMRENTSKIPFQEFIVDPNRSDYYDWLLRQAISYDARKENDLWIFRFYPENKEQQEMILHTSEQFKWTKKQ